MPPSFSARLRCKGLMSDKWSAMYRKTNALKLNAPKSASNQPQDYVTEITSLQLSTFRDGQRPPRECPGHAKEDDPDTSIARPDACPIIRLIPLRAKRCNLFCVKLGGKLYCECYVQ